LKWIKKENKKLGREIYGITKFLDLTKKEFIEKYLIIKDEDKDKDNKNEIKYLNESEKEKEKEKFLFNNKNNNNNILQYAIINSNFNF
jgi:hypothetical protein